MCGLVGICGDTTGSWKDVFNELLIVDVVRGPHSTGAGFVGRNDENFMLDKRLGDPFNLLRSDEYNKAMSLAYPQKVMMGHNRSATIGDKTEENAHPFKFDHIIGAHNGTLDKWCIKDLTNHHLYGTDSQAIFATMNEKSVDEALKEMSGAWAMTWYDNRDHTFNMLRNNKRPLHYTYSSDRSTLIWASEAEMLEYVLNRRRKTMQKDDKDINQIFSLPSDMLYSWNIPSSFTGKIESPLQRKIEGKAWSSYTPFVMGKVKTKIGSHTVGHQSSPTNLPEFDHRPRSKKFRHPYKDKYGRTITKKEFEALVDEGCMFCNSNGQHFGEFIQIIGPYIGYHTPYACDECYNSPEQYELMQFAF